MNAAASPRRVERTSAASASPANDVGLSAQEAGYRATASVHYPNMDELTMTVRVNLMAQRDRASAALNRCCPEAANTLVEANRLASLAALSTAPTRTLAFTLSAVESLIFAAQQLQRGQA